MKDATVSPHIEYNLKIKAEAILSEADLYAKLQHSYAQSLAGKGKPYREVFDELERNLNV